MALPRETPVGKISRVSLQGVIFDRLLLTITKMPTTMFTALCIDGKTSIFLRSLIFDYLEATYL
jgi:hypothetical protein